MMLAKSMHQIARIGVQKFKISLRKGALPPCDPRQGLCPLDPRQGASPLEPPSLINNLGPPPFPAAGSAPVGWEPTRGFSRKKLSGSPGQCLRLYLGHHKVQNSIKSPGKSPLSPDSWGPEILLITALSKKHFVVLPFSWVNQSEGYDCKYETCCGVLRSWVETMFYFTGS